MNTVRYMHGANVAYCSNCESSLYIGDAFEPVIQDDTHDGIAFCSPLCQSEYYHEFESDQLDIDSSHDVAHIDFDDIDSWYDGNAGSSPATCDYGCIVEPDGYCEHGKPSILIAQGLI